MVVYTPFNWRLVQLPALYVQSLERFLQETDHNKPRFEYAFPTLEGDACPFIREHEDERRRTP
jgi:hypothetical protein